MERRRAFRFFSSGAMGSGLELWFRAEESRLLLFILKGGAGGFSSVSRLSDIFSNSHSFLASKEKGGKEKREVNEGWLGKTGKLKQARDVRIMIGYVL